MYIFSEIMSSEELIPLNLTKSVQNTHMSNQDKSNSSSNLHVDKSFTQEPNISKCGKKLKCKNPAFTRNPVVQVNIQSECSKALGTLYFTYFTTKPSI